MYQVCTYLWPAGGQRFTASCTHLQTAVRSQWAAAVADSCRPSWIIQTSQTSRQRRRFGVETHQCRCRKGRVPKGWLKHEFPVPKNRWNPCWQTHCEGIYIYIYIWCLDAMICVYFACACIRKCRPVTSMILTCLKWWLEWQSHCWAVHCVAFGIWRKHIGKPGDLGSMFNSLHVYTRGSTKHPWHAKKWRERKIMSGTNGWDARNSWRCLGRKGRRRSLSRCRRHGLIQRFHVKPWSFYPQITDGVSCFFILFKWRNCSAALRIHD